MSALQTVQIPSLVREFVDARRAEGKKIALVPTMGNLHDGHLSLITRARENADRVVCSIFVNPTQFGPDEDLDGYPRTLELDKAALENQGGVDLLFLPDMRTIYPYGTDSAVSIALPPLSRDLCGASRPGHFDGVASVVLRLMNIVTPHTLLLGDKDYQQRVLLERMLRDLHIPASVVSADIYREPDGLAMSSRNSYLTAEERAIAPGLYETLSTTVKALRKNDQDYAVLETAAMEQLAERGFKPEYVSVRRARDLAPPDVFEAGDERIVLAAAWLGRARLIDNLKV